MNETKDLEVLVRAMLSSGALSVSPEHPFLWASGYKMPIYLDNRLLLGLPEVRKIIGALFLKETRNAEAIAGVATAGIPHATTLSDMADLPLLYVRPKPKDHGQGKQVEGGVPGGLAGKNVVVVEDTISTGGSAKKAIEALKNEGAIVTTCLSIFFYAFKNSEPFPELIPLLTFETLMDIAEKEDLLPKQTIAILKEWHEDPFSWGEKNGFPKQD